MANVVYETWKTFLEALHRFAAQSRDRRQQFLFRGQSNSSWPLLTTLDRFHLLTVDTERDRLVADLLQEFSREAAQVATRAAPLPDDRALEMVARHHGLPSPLLDWTRSPFIASFFAFEDANASHAVWVLDRNKLPAGLGSVDVIDDHTLLQYNRRALRQQSVFLRVGTASKPLEELLVSALSRFEMPAADRRLAMVQLDAMNINATTLFDDFDGVARTVRTRMTMT